MSKPDYAKINVAEAREFFKAADGCFEVALLAVILHCSKSIESSVRIDNNSAVRGFICDVAANLGDIRDSIDALGEKYGKEE